MSASADWAASMTPFHEGDARKALSGLSAAATVARHDHAAATAIAAEWLMKRSSRG
ncbi:hypothetical protein GZL_09017 [Streptomyces sp. 769]|nr:hypothetical protein GZL_09017 [Streptomyces sp. 769]